MEDLIPYKLSNEETVAINILDKLVSATCTSDQEVVTDDENSTDTSTSQNLIYEAYKKVDSLCPNNVKRVLGPKLYEIIYSTCTNALTIPTLEKLIKENFNRKLFTTKKEKEFLFNIEVTLKAAIVYYLYLRKDLAHETSTDDLIKEYGQYPMFATDSMDENEIQYIVNFRNMLKIALQVIPANRNKMLLINICSVLEGSGRVYVTGGTQSMATSRRMQIYEHESGLQKRRRPERRLEVSKKEKPKQLINCSCGAVILKRTVWKHSQSKKHRLFELYGEQQCNLGTTMTVSSEEMNVPPFPEFNIPFIQIPVFYFQ
mmetsp:Transcript_11485/g.15814  ORF Transcript_11485/g.15814 Transcript_11485/m.15814 type:complete len:316 (+) Transcript_11485:73-1020(+)